MPPALRAPGGGRSRETGRKTDPEPAADKTEERCCRHHHNKWRNIKMAMYRKLGKKTKLRKALVRNPTTAPI